MAVTFDTPSGSAILSNGDLTITATAYNYKYALATVGKTSGKHYFEILAGASLGDSDTCCGIANADVSTSICISGLDGLVLRRFGAANYNGSFGVFTYATDTSSGVIRVAVDLDAQLAWVALNGLDWNNNSAADPETGANGIDISGICDKAIYPVACPVATSDAYTGRFADADFDYAVPAGFTAWDSAPPPVDVLWSDTDKSAGVTLTDADLTATVADNEDEVQGVRSTEGHLTGKKYFELNIKGSYGGTTLGVIRESGDLQTNGIGIPWSGAYFPVMPGKPGTIALYNGVHDVTIRFLVDIDGKKIYYSGVGVTLGPTSADRDTFFDIPDSLTWNYLPAGGDTPTPLHVFMSSIGRIDSPSGKFDAVEVTANFGADPFTYDIPDGYTSWDGSQEGDPLVPPPVPKRPNGRVLITSDQVTASTPYNGILSKNGGAFAYVNTGARSSGLQIARPASAYSKELGRFVLVGGNMFGIDLDKYYAWSDDAETWNFVAGPGYAAECAVWGAGPGLFVALCSSGTDRLLTSPDGKTWTERSTTDDSKNWRAVAYSPDLGRYVAVAYDSDVFMYSDDGINWTGGTLPSDSYWSGIAWSPLLQKFVVCNQYSGVVLHSDDGITWTSHSISLVSGRAICWAPELSAFVIAGSGVVKISEDGLAWTDQSTTDNQSWRDVAWSEVAGLLYVVSPNGYINESPDGVAWDTTSVVSGDQTDWIRILDAPQRDLDTLTLTFTDEAELEAVSPLVNPLENLSAEFLDEAVLTANITVGNTLNLSATFLDEATLTAVSPINDTKAPPIQTIIIALG